ncbi:putative c6 transcription factor [Diplodia seriata]|nr:putative c6 transcription factor [Diplodia seriata]
MILHREYIPFIPLRSPKPQGPLDPPVFPSDEYAVPEGFWEQSARELFKSAREVIDLLRICQEWNVLVETPIVGFAAYTAAFTGVYAINFPWMDPYGHMCKGTQSRDAVKSETGDSPGAEAARKALEITSQMRRALHMADGWFRTLKRVHVYYIRIKKDFRRNAKATASLSPGAESLRNLTLREGGAGGGLEEYKLLEKSLREFGSLWDENEDLDMLDAGDEERRPDTSSSMPSGEPMDTSNAPDAIRQERWNAINTVAAAASQQNAANGATTYGPGRIPISNPSPEQSKPPQLPGHSPILSPPGSASAASNTPYDRPSGFTPIQHQQHPHSNPADPYGTHQPAYTSASSFSPTSQEAWLDNLDTRFGGDDIAAFIAGTNWEDWAAMAQPGEQGVSGWLSAVWMGAPGPPPTPGRS